MTAPSRVLRTGGLYFNGRNAYVEVADDESLDLTELTITARLKTTQVGTPYYRVFSRGDTATWEINPYQLGFRGGDGKVQLTIGDNTNWNRCVGTTDIRDGKEHFIAGVVTGSELQVFVDGILENTETQTITPFVYRGSAMIAKAGDKYLEGIIKHVRIYNIALEQSQIQQLCENPYAQVAMDNCVLWLPFTENMGVVAKDYSGNNNHGRLYNCKWVNRQRRGMYFDNGGIRFDSGLNIDCNYCSVVAVFAIEMLEKGGTFLTGRNCVVKPSGDKLMLYNSHANKKLIFTNYDGAWKPVLSNIDLEAGQIYTGVGIMNSNEEHIYLASNGVIIDHNYRDDLGDCGEYINSSVFVGSNAAGNYPLHGEVLAAMIYNRPITEDEIKQISEINGWFDPPRDGLISWILFDGLKEGDTPVDLITGAEGVQIGTPKFVIRKPVRVLSV